MFTKVQLRSLFKILAFLLLLHPIDASADVEEGRPPLRRQTGNDNWLEEPENPKASPAGICEFETGNFCLWVPDPHSQLQWSIARATWLNKTYAPTTDHTRRDSTGHYAWLEYGGQGNATSSSPVAVLTLNEPIAFPSCISLWYSIDGATSWSLSITHIGDGKRHIDGFPSAPTNGLWKFGQLTIRKRDSLRFHQY